MDSLHLWILCTHTSDMQRPVADMNVCGFARPRTATPRTVATIHLAVRVGDSHIECNNTSKKMIGPHSRLGMSGHRNSPRRLSTAGATRVPSGDRYRGAPGLSPCVPLHRHTSGDTSQRIRYSYGDVSPEHHEPCCCKVARRQARGVRVELRAPEPGRASRRPAWQESGWL